VILGEPLVVLGRTLVVEPVDRLPLTFIFITGAALFIIAWRLLPHSNFFPNGLAMISLLAGALLVEQVVYAALLVEMAAILAVFPLHEPVAQTIEPELEEEEPVEDDDLFEAKPDLPKFSRRTKGGVRYMT
jgi:hypothetical protein